MANIGQRGMPSTNTTPSRFPETTPPAYPSFDHSFTLQAIMEMQKTLGKLEEAVTSLREDSKKHGDKIDDMGQKIYTAKTILSIIGVIIIAFGGIITFLLTKIWEAAPSISTILKK